MNYQTNTQYFASISQIQFDAKTNQAYFGYLQYRKRFQATDIRDIQSIQALYFNLKTRALRQHFFT